MFTAIIDSNSNIVEDCRRGKSFATIILLHLERKFAREDTVIIAAMRLLPFDIDHFIIHIIIESWEDIIVLVIAKRIRERVLSHARHDQCRAAIDRSTLDVDSIRALGFATFSADQSPRRADALDGHREVVVLTIAEIISGNDMAYESLCETA